MEQHDILRTEDFDRVIDLFEGTHTRRNDDRLALGACVTEQGVVGEAGRGDFVGRRVEGVDEDFY